ncbi:AI-2E family transporter [Pedosphaera parvula]|uniref:AI-2E family transporter n=1 Tax=Pedosphaera parvula (strain Ellin514) TaxID=320771 RepID=B9XSL8_PEDPL|nr:AI-2E family transporter [Pedosphaera parvula]EEF57178.1 protein of unknown function UPF0118 [Pedosphaera parvula Ellin514]
MEKSSGPSLFAIIIPWRTILKIAAACLLAYITVRLSRFLALLALSLLLAIAFRPLFRWTARHHWPKSAGILACGSILFCSTALVFGLLVPAISKQGTEFIQKLPEFKERILQSPPASGVVRNLADRFFSASAYSNLEPLLKKAVTWGGVGLERMAEFFLVLILSLYLIAEGDRVYRWLIAFLPEEQRRKTAAAAEEITEVVSQYVVGNIITSVICGIYAFTVLKLLHVPNAALLAVMAGIFDLLPIIGFFLFTIPAVLLALTVSVKAAMLVAILYSAYHLAENYFIVPKVYGNRLRLSELTVLISCLAAGLIAGVIGVLLVLPIIASYPTIERIWLRPYLQRDTIQRHEELDTQEHSRVE